MNNIFTKHIRNSRMALKEVYFWTDTIKDWKHLLKPDKYKAMIIEELQWLKSHNKIEIYGFVIMPNHLHLLWEMLTKNGKEMPYASFNKWTASQFLKDLRINHPGVIPFFEEKTEERDHRFWQTDPKAILMDGRKKFEQKLDYIHNNPLHERWNLAKSPEEYRWSSANFYMSGKDEFGLLTHYMDRF
jgi:putative transposase